MAIADMQGVTSNLNKMADQMKNMYEQSQNGHIINSEDIANIEKMNREIQDLVQNSRDAKEQLAGTISDLGRNFSSVIEGMQALRNNNPSAEISHQLDEASSKISQFIGIFQQLGQTKLEINADNIKDITKMTEDARQAIEDMQAAMSKGGNASALEPVLNNLKAISDVFKDGNVSNQINATAEAMGNLNRVFGDQGQVMQNSSMSIKALGDQMGELSKLTQNMNSGLSDMFNQITNSGAMQNATPFTVINEQIQKITSAIDVLKSQVKSPDVWNNPENLGDETRRIEAALQQVLGQQKQAFSQALGNVSSSNLEDTLKQYNEFRDGLLKNINSMRDVLSDSKQLPEIPADASQELIDQIEAARKNAQKYLTDVHAKLEQSKFSSLEGVVAQSVQNDFHNVMGSGGSDRNDMLMRMATGQSLGSNFDYNLGRIGNQAANIYNRAIVLDSAAHDPNSDMNSYQRHAVDYQGVASQAQQLARMQQEYSSVKDQFSGAYTSALKETDPGKRDQAMEKAKERYEYMVKMQNKIKDHAIDMGKSFKVSSPEDKERLGKEAAELYDYVRSVVKETASSGDSLFAMGKTLEVKPEILAGLKEGTNGVKDMKAAMEDAEKQSKSLWSSMNDGIKDMMSPLRAIGKGLGILGVGSLGGGPLAMLTKSLQYHSEQGRDIYESQRTGLQYGLDGDYGLGNTINRLHRGAELHQQSGGRIGITELNKAYDSAMGSVGGRYGVSAEQGASDMNSLVNNTFMMQKVYGIDQGTMNDAYKTFYKDMGQSADEAANSIAKLTQTAAAANIPAGQYLKMVSGIAQQFMKIGLSGKDAENMMGNFIHQGMRAEVAQSMASQTGQAMGNFAQNKSMVGYSTAMMGGDPFAGMATAAYSHEADGSERKGWSKEVAKMMDTMTNQMDLVTGGDPNLRRIVLTDHFKGMGYDQRGSSALTSAFMSGNHEVFENALKKQNERLDNPNASLEAVNNKLSQQLDKIAGNLSEQDKLAAEINRNLYELAFKTGPSIDQALRQLHDSIMKFVGAIGDISQTIANGLAKFTNSGLFQNGIKPGLELAAEHPILATAGTYAAWKMARGKWSLPKMGGPGGTHGGTGGPANIIKALSKNPKTAAFALGAGIVAYNSIGSAHSREGDVNERTYDKLHAIHQSMLNGEIKLGNAGGGGSSYGGQGGYGSKESGYESESAGLAAGSGIAALGSMAVAGRANGVLERFIGTAKHADDYKVFGKMAMQGEADAAGLAVQSGAKLMRNAFAKNAVTGLITEGAFGAYDLYEHRQKGDLMQGDANRVGANAAVNLGYMATGAAIGSIIPGVGTVAGGIAGGLIGLGVDAFGEKDANGKGFNDRAKDMLYSLSTGGDTLDALEKRRSSLNEKDKIKAKLQMLGYSDEEAKKMSNNLIDNKVELEKHGISITKMTDEQKTFMALHAKQIDLNKIAVDGNSEQSKKVCDDLKDLSSAIRNTPLGDKINRDVNNGVDANRSKIEHELDDKAVLSTMFNHKTFDLKQWREKLVEELKANPEDSGKMGEIADVDEKLKKLERAKYLVDGGEEQRRKDHGQSWEDLNIFTRGGQSKEEYINNQLALDWKAANEMRDLYSGEYVDKRIADGALSADAAVENAVTNPGGTATAGAKEAEDRKDQKADDSRKQAANSNADKVIKQNQKQEELNKEGNKLTNTLIDQEKTLFKALEASGNSNTKQLHTKLEEMRKLLEKIQVNTLNISNSSGGYTGRSNNKTATESLIAKKLKGMGYDDNAVAAIMGNIKQESNFSTKITQEKYDPKTGLWLGGGGLFQFTDDRLKGLYAYAKKNNLDPESVDAQLGYMQEEVTSSRKEFSPQNFHPVDAAAGAYQWGKGYEVTAVQGNRGAYAAEYAGNIQSYYNAKEPASVNQSEISQWVTGKTDGLDPAYLARLVALAKAKGKPINVSSGTRDYATQVETWDRNGHDNSVAARPGESRHGIGYAIDTDTDWLLDMSDEELREYGLQKPLWNDKLRTENWHIEPTETDGVSTAELKRRLGGVSDEELGHIDWNQRQSILGSGGSYQSSPGSAYYAPNNVDQALYNMTLTQQQQAAQQQQASGTTPTGTTAPGTTIQGVVGDAKSALNSKTGKAFYDGTMIQHHLGGVGIWYGNQSGRTLNWDTMQAAMHEAGGAGTDIGGHRKWAAESRKARIESDAKMGVTVQNPVAARNAVKITPINSEIAKDMAKNIEAQNIPTTITNSNVIKAASEQATGQENAGREISVSISIDKAMDRFVEGFSDALKETVQKLGARVEKIEERTVKTAQTARTALHSGIDQKKSSQEEQFGGR